MRPLNAPAVVVAVAMISIVFIAWINQISPPDFVGAPGLAHLPIQLTRDLVSFLGALGTVGATALLYYTLKETRRIGEAQNRAYLVCKDIVPDWMQEKDGTFSLALQVQWLNAGASPALDSYVSCVIFEEGKYSVDEIEQTLRRDAFASTPIGQSVIRNSNAGRMNVAMTNLVRAGIVKVCVASLIRYSDIYGIRFEAMVCKRVTSNHPIGPPTLLSIEFSTHSELNYFRRV